MFMDDNNIDDLVIRKEDRVMMKFLKSEMFYEIVFLMFIIEFIFLILFVEFEFKLESEDVKDYIYYVLEEIMVVMSGVVDICMGEKVVRLNLGDLIFIKVNVLYKIINLSKDIIVCGYGVILFLIWLIKFK